MSFGPGTILKRRLGGLFGLFYSHMGVYIGNGRVVHFNGETKNSWNAVLRTDTLQEFVNGQAVSVHAVPKSWRHGEDYLSGPTQTRGTAEPGHGTVPGARIASGRAEVVRSGQGGGHDRTDPTANPSAEVPGR